MAHGCLRASQEPGSRKSPSIICLKDMYVQVWSIGIIINALGVVILLHLSKIFFTEPESSVCYLWFELRTGKSRQSSSTHHTPARYHAAIGLVSTRFDARRVEGGIGGGEIPRANNIIYHLYVACSMLYSRFSHRKATLTYLAEVLI